MGLPRKILGKRTIQQVPEEEPEVIPLRPLKLKRSHSHARDDEDGEGPLQLSSPSANGAGAERPLAPLYCPPAPKKPRLVLGRSLDGFKVLRVMDLRCFLR